MAGDGKQTGPLDGANTTSEADLEARRKALDARIGQIRQLEEERQAPAARAKDETAFGRGFRYSAEFAGGVGAGAILGWVIDTVLGISPWGLLVGILLGFGAGMLNLLRASERDRLADLAKAQDGAQQ